MKKIQLRVMLLLILLISVGCKTNQSTIQQPLEDVKVATENTTDISGTTPLNQAMTVIGLIKDQNMTALAAYVHPTLGVRFSPYSYVDTTNDIVFTSAQIAQAMTESTSYNWGNYDGSGEPIQATFANYYMEFIYDQDFENPHLIGNQNVIGVGNTENNITTAYPNGSYIEFHFTGFDPTYEGIDWKSLRLVFENVSGTWYLVGIIHDGWTI